MHFGVGHDHNTDVTWTPLRLESPATRLFIQQLMCANDKDNIEAPQLLEESTNIALVDSHHKGPVMRKSFSDHDVIMW